MHPVKRLLLSLPALLLGLGSAAPAQTYTNPVITNSNLADPDVFLYNGTYYLSATGTNTSFSVRTSTNLSSWNNGSVRLNFGSTDAWAPDFYRHNENGKFYLYYSRAGLCAVAESSGSTPDTAYTVVNSNLVVGIDPHLFRDDDGQLYLYYSRGVTATPQLQQTWVARMSSPTAVQAGTAVMAIDSLDTWEARNTEGPFVLKRNGLYYLMYSGDGYATDEYAVGYATSTSPMGPFTRHPGNPILFKRAPGSPGVGASPPGAIGPGHHSVTTDRYGNLWMVYHQRQASTSTWERYVCIDPMWFNSDGTLDTWPTRGVSRPGPATATPTAVPVITTGQTFTAYVGAKFYGLIARTTSTNPQRAPGAFSATNLPPGLEINNHGILSGRPTAAGTYVVSVTASNSVGSSTAVNVTVNVLAPAAQGAAEPYAGYPSTLVQGGSVLGAGFTGTFRTVNAAGTSFPVQAAGLSYGNLQTSGVALGTANSSWTSIVADLNMSVGGPFETVRDTYGDVGASGNRLYISFLVKSPFAANSPMGMLQFLKDGDLDTNRRFELGVTGSALHVGSFFNTKQGTLPTPSANQTVLFVVAIDYTGNKDDAWIYVNPPLGAEPSTPTITLAETCEFDRIGLRSNGPGIVFDEIRVGRTWAEVVPVNAAPPSIPAGQTASGVAGQPFTYAIQADGQPTSWTLASGSLPAGVTLNTSTGVLSGTPTVSGAFSPSFTATNAQGSSSAQTVSVNIASASPGYEPFNYTGALPGQAVSSGTALSGSWRSASGSGLVFSGASPGLAFTGLAGSANRMATSGSGWTSLVADLDVAGALAAYDNGSGKVGKDNTVLYASYLLKSPDTSTFAVLQFLNGGDTDSQRQFELGANNADLWSNAITGGAATVQTGAVTANTPVLVVVRFTFKAGADDIAMWVNPTPGSAEPAPALNRAALLNLAFDRLALRTSKAGVDLDEIRLGGSWASVLPAAAPVPVITAGQSASGAVNSAFSYTVAASNSPTVWTLVGGSLPAGVALDNATGVLSGTPAASGVFTPSFTAANAVGASPAASVTLTISPDANSIVAESFEYSAGSGALAGQNGGQGWTAAWDAGANDIDATGSSYSSSGVLHAPGGKALVLNNVSSFRSLPATYSNGTYWLSFVARSTAPGSAWGGLSLFDGASERVFVGQRYGASVWGVERNGSAGVNSSAATSSSTFVVVKVVLQSGNDHVYLWTNPSLAAEPAESSATQLLNVADFSFSRVRLGQGLGAGQTLEFDELRLGTTFDSVTPATGQ